jgi:nitrite reductase/ring-hydroxylating ferredoxin subunit
MDDFVRVASLDELTEGKPLDVEIDGDVLVLVTVDGEIYALSGWCTHLGTALALGSVTDHTLMCWAHLWRYDVRTGEPIWPAIAKIAPGYRLRTYAVRVDGNDVYVSRLPGRRGLN